MCKLKSEDLQFEPFIDRIEYYTGECKTKEGLRKHMLSVLGKLPVLYARFTQDGLVTPSHCFYLKRSPQLQLGFSLSPSQRNCFKSYCKKRDKLYSQELKGFSALQQEDSPWESDNIWSNLSLYLFTLHIPLSFGGLSVVSLIAQQPLLHPQTQVILYYNNSCKAVQQNIKLEPLFLCDILHTNAPSFLHLAHNLNYILLLFMFTPF